MDEEKAYRSLNREIFLLIALSVVAVGVFLFTKRMSIKVQQLDARIAAIWYQKGERQLASGQVEKAIDSFRKATTGALGNPTYTLALANALAAANHDAEAEQTLLRLRESDPEDAEINLQLARLATRRGEVEDAVHYYRNALYGRWNEASADQRKQQVRMELIRFLLGRQQRGLALSELLILESDLPQSAAAHVEVARLFLQAGDVQHAMENYEQATELDKNDADALAEAGETAFRVGDYQQADHYLKEALELKLEDQKIHQHLTVAEFVLSTDPLDPHLTKEERQERLLRGFDQSLRRLEGCLSQASGSQGNAELQSLKEQATAMEPKLRSKRPPDLELTRSAAQLIFKVEQAALARCGQGEELDQALLLISHKHSGAQP
jgi:tetratricopeptide (TPR) repeat protein